MRLCTSQTGETRRDWLSVGAAKDLLQRDEACLAASKGPGSEIGRTRSLRCSQN